MSFNITEFKSAIDRGIVRPNAFSASIFFNKLSTFGQKQLRILCEGAELPGKRFDTTPELMYGVSRKMPFGMVFEDLSLTFICTSRMEERYFFDRWASFICNPTSNYMHYFDDYKSNIMVEQYDSTGRVIYVTFMEEAYPISILPQQLNYSDENNYVKLTVDFAYRRWRNELEVAGNKMQKGYGFDARIDSKNNTDGDNHTFKGHYNAPTVDEIDKQQDYQHSFGDFLPGSFDRAENNNSIFKDPVQSAQTNIAQDIGPGSFVDAVTGDTVIPNEATNATPTYSDKSQPNIIFDKSDENL